MTSSNQTDEVQHAPHKPQGYHRFAGIMSRDKSLAIFRRFDDLFYLSLMSIQAEILGLRDSFRHQCERDRISGNQSATDSSPYFLELYGSNENESTQLKRLIEIRSKLREYCRLFHHVATLLAANGWL
jgi:hypothetical protein